MSVPGVQALNAEAHELEELITENVLTILESSA